MNTNAEYVAKEATKKSLLYYINLDKYVQYGYSMQKRRKSLLCVINIFAVIG